MSIHCYTSISFTYLAKARVLAWSLKRFHPDWIVTVCITDIEPDGFVFDIDQEPFDQVIWAHELPVSNIKPWLFRHEVVEACTAVKGPVMKLLMEQRGAEKIFYLDPDIVVFSSLSPLVEMLEDASILLTPHQLAPEQTESAIRDNELTSLRLGTYNLGFVGVRNDEVGEAFANWWNDRLIDYCYDEPERGVFVDQKWCDLVPALFSDVQILRDPGFNVASWNLSNRRVEITRSGDVLVNGGLLRFFHFTKLGVEGDIMTQRFAGENTDVYELWAWYRTMVDRFKACGVPDGWWYYGKYSNDELVTREHRILYRERKDLQMAYEDPFSTEPGGYYTWLISQGNKLQKKINLHQE